MRSSSTTRSMHDAEIFWELHVPWLLEIGRDTGFPELDVVVRFSLRGALEQSWSAVVRDGQILEVARGAIEEPDILISLEAGELVAIATGDVDHREAFFAGRVDVEGDIATALWLANLIPFLRERFPFDPSSYRPPLDPRSPGCQACASQPFLT